MKLSNLPLLLFFLVLSAISVTVGGYWTSMSVSDWYLTLKRPDWNPPSWVFGPVWTALYTLMAISAWRAWVRGRGSARKWAMGAYGCQLLFNTTWSGAFFAMRSPMLGLVNIVILWILILWTIERFWKVSRFAATLMTPYFLWVTFAGAVNYAIWRLNP